MQQRTLIRFIPAVGLVTFGLVVSACGAEQTQQRSPRTAAGSRIGTQPEPRLVPASRPLTDAERRGTPPAVADCPMTLEGTKVTALPREDGMALAFETRSGSIDELRRRVRWLAAEYESRSDVMLGTAGMAPASDVGRPGVRVDVEDLQNGAKIVFAGHRQGAIDALRIELREQADNMTELRSCDFLSEDLGPSAAQR